MISYLQLKSTYKLVGRNAMLNLTLSETVTSLDKKFCIILVNESNYSHCQIFFSQSQIFSSWKIYLTKRLAQWVTFQVNKSALHSLSLKTNNCYWVARTKHTYNFKVPQCWVMDLHFKIWLAQHSGKHQAIPHTPGIIQNEELTCTCSDY